MIGTPPRHASTRLHMTSPHTTKDGAMRGFFDAAETIEMRRLAQHVRGALPALRGTWHAAGVLADGVLAGKLAAGNCDDRREASAASGDQGSARPRPPARRR